MLIFSFNFEPVGYQILHLITERLLRRLKDLLRAIGRKKYGSYWSFPEPLQEDILVTSPSYGGQSSYHLTGQNY